MKLIVVKNPNVARRFAEALNIGKREADYFKGEEFYITWVLVSGGDKASAFVPSCYRKIENRVQSLQNLVKNCEGIITPFCSTEELKLFKEFYESLNSDLPIQIININSLTHKSIRKGLENRTDIKDLQKLLSKQKTKENHILKYNENNPLNIYGELEEIKKYQIQLGFTKDFLKLTAYSVQLFQDEQSAEETLSTILRKGNLLVNEVKYEKEIQPPPLLYNATTLQEDCKKTFGFTEYQIIELSESLYEKGFITNPHTEIQTIHQGSWQDIKEIVRTLVTKPSLDLELNQLKMGKLSKQILCDNSSIGREGIYPTGIIPSSLNLKENKLYDLIALRFLESLSEPCRMDTVKGQLRTLTFKFTFQAFQLLEAGWRGFQNSFYETNSEIYPHLPGLEQNESQQILTSKIISAF